jgi:hypothetical protein
VAAVESAGPLTMVDGIWRIDGGALAPSHVGTEGRLQA